jgi:two-component system LytT family response regulator
MNKITCVIVDDEEPGRIVLRELLSLYCQNVEIKGEASNIEDAFALINKCRPEIVFLDIQMPKGSGFDLLRKFSVIDFDVVFTTSFDQYAIEAIKVNALDYLLKPIDTEELLAAVEKVNKREIEKKLTRAKIVVHHKDRVKLVNVSEIVCLEADSSYTRIYTNDGQRYTPAHLLKSYEDMLETNEDFVRISRSVIINLKYLREYSKGEPCILFLSNDQSYEISRRRKGELMSRLR